VSIRLRQGDRDSVLIEDTFEAPELARTYDVGALLTERAALTEGPAELVVSATDRALRHLGRGNQAEATRAFTVDFTPPRLEVVPGIHSINQGGSEGVVYQVSSDAVESGVQVGPHFFRGVAYGDRFLSLFAFRYDLAPDTPVQVIARDAAGNETAVDVARKVFPKTFRQREIVLDDAFMNKVVSEIMPRTPSVADQGSLVKNYVELNSTLRRQNHERIAELSADLPGAFLFRDAFVQLSNSQVEAVYADHRAYRYGAEIVDRQDHVGFDLSVVARTPIEASNDGRVIYADYFGIYGNTVMIDHGMGLVSLYGHMSQIDVGPGQTVTRGEIIGRSGATGMAGGDHLHFGLFIRGVPVNPTEWWDAHWIRDHVWSLVDPPGAPGA
jgi:murein DD-endopeptidase MepM/ murein hydrolase activator NlpD